MNSAGGSAGGPRVVPTVITAIRIPQLRLLHLTRAVSSPGPLASQVELASPEPSQPRSQVANTEVVALFPSQNQISARDHDAQCSDSAH